jgi:hypothetical protein|nr:MAG TPA: hypothetical protein [Caudoviricetes sp.]DAN50156.1 MAG TPA: hypothetical protein [Caudoviricetes sp.]DAR56187.1 MAG TPA: hypothetical protein [Caudoviricetes sp.]
MATIRSDLESYVIAHDETQAHVLAPGAEVPDGVTIHPDLLEPEPEDPEDPEDPEESGDDGAGGEDKPPASPKTNRRSSSRARKS